MRKAQHSRYSSLLISLLLLSAPALANELDTLLAEITGKDAETSYNRLINAESQFAGTPSFDHALGVAALESGHYSEASFALEREVAADPNNASAYLELGRAYHAMGDYPAAEAAFQQVEAKNPPAEVLSILAKYRTAQSAETSKLKGSVYFTLGRSNNLPAGPAESPLYFPIEPTTPVTLADYQQAKADRYTMAGATLSYYTTLSGNWIADMGIGALTKHNHRFTNLDNDQFSANLGATYQQQNDRVRFGLAYTKNYLDNNAYLSDTQASIDWGHLLSPNSEITIYGKLNTYNQLQSDNDSKRWTLGSRYVESFEDLPFKPMLQTGFYFGSQKSKQSANNYTSNHFLGYQLGGLWQLNEKTAAYLTLAYEWRKYLATHPQYLSTRKDGQWDIRLGMNYLLAPHLTITPQLSWTKNRSNQAISQYKQTRFDLTVKYDFE
ncbi:tetratricopeptide repeat protein [Leeia sp. TBRC 13508]|uniref:Tetratricopeptide repeat protein n=1 Tax=Leeia speluncae TaxID=2884804 RepID=A0ABS8D5I1_9NEIS|nr:tetratricopeptide repeat protein [Leeia speluncae]MCB6183458.1 tetratricopeptide repeat protein [Leeia speluncae]